jgi:acyl carrier protein
MSMTRDEIFAQIRETLVENFEIDPAAIKPESKLIDDLGLDSIDAIDMAVRIQQMTKSRVEEDELRKLRTVDDTVNLVARLLAQGN